MWVEVEKIVKFPFSLKNNLANLNLKPLRELRGAIIEVAFHFVIDWNLKPQNQNKP